MPADEPATPWGSSGRRRLDMLVGYFKEDRSIILPVGVFVTDSAMRADGTWGASEFDYATGDLYHARMKRLERDTGYLLCDCDKKRSV